MRLSNGNRPPAYCSMLSLALIAAVFTATHHQCGAFQFQSATFHAASRLSLRNAPSSSLAPISSHARNGERGNTASQPHPVSVRSTRLFMSDLPQDTATSKRKNGKASTKDTLGSVSSEEPTMNGSSNASNGDQALITQKSQQQQRKRLPSWKDLIPPPPEDQFTMIGDLSSLFIYAFSSHFLNDFIVNNVLRTSESLEDALLALDPMQEITNLNIPIWLSDQPQHIQQQVQLAGLRHDLLDHWSPLFSTAGTAFVAISTCWLLAGYVHKAFLFRNTLECDTSHTLTKTLETWITCGILLTLAVAGCSELVSHLPMVKHLLGIGCTECLQEHWITKADVMYIVDSLTVLILWRFIMNTMLGYGNSSK